MAEASISFKPRDAAQAAIAPEAPVVVLPVEGMDCANCAQSVQRALTGVPGVKAAVVSLQERRVSVRLDQAQPASRDQLVAAVTGAGYRVPEPRPDATQPHAGEDHDHDHDHANPWRTAIWLGIPVTLAGMVAEWIFGLGMNRGYHWAAFALTLPVQVIVGGKFYVGAWRQLRVGRSNMDTLVALGSTAAFGFSAWALFAGWPGHLYFMESAGILTLISLGHWLEARMSAKAGAALKALLTLAPTQARKLTPGSTAEQEAPVASLRAGDRIALRPGDRVPVDAEVIEGSSAVDEAMLTGEPVPVEKSAGSKLFAGTVSQSGSLVARVTATGEATALAHIVAAVERAQSSRANIQRLADRVSSVFVPIVVVIALASALWWGLAYESAVSFHEMLGRWLWPAHLPPSPVAAAVFMAAAVLIVACPCAMGLATPTALMAGINAALRRGILIRDALALEKSGRINAVVFDKTGTLTEGRPKVVATEDFRPTAGRDVALAELVASLARRSQHPLSRTLATLSPGNVVVEGWRELRGAGVEARVAGKVLRVGSVAWFRDEGIDLGPVQAFLKSWQDLGATIVLLVADREVWGTFALRDELKTNAKDVVQQLQTGGHQIFLLTGDNRHTAAAVGALAGVPTENIFAEVHPTQKAAKLQELQARGLRVAFVGDGLNDGPALAQADLGIAVTQATDVAKEAADILLLKSDLAAIPSALGLAQATLRTIHQNLFWAFFYNAAFVPLAAVGFLSPMLAAVAMGMSDLMLIANSLRLSRK